jgi:hypothetical protein
MDDIAPPWTQIMTSFVNPYALGWTIGYGEYYKPYNWAYIHTKNIEDDIVGAHCLLAHILTSKVHVVGYWIENNVHLRDFQHESCFVAPR